VQLTGDAFNVPRRQVNNEPWTWLSQVHGTKLVAVDFPGHHSGAIADGAFTTQTNCPIAVTTADCAPVVLTTTLGVSVVHAGWKGALAGIIGVAAEQMLRTGGAPVHAWLGPCIGPGTYEFGAADLEAMVARFGEAVASETIEGKPALDMPAVIRAACIEAGWPGPARPVDTADPRFFSHRVRCDKGRQTTVACIYD
jgi:copper oxidase (laccase) domain-containing protein